jgi:diguanylate cyclase
MMLTESDILNASILIVDDQDTNIILLEQLLSEAGYTCVDSTMNPLEVCALHGKNNYDLILLDLQMPDMNGFQVMQSLKAQNADGYLPVLVLTAQPDHKLRALQCGAKDFICKPFDLVEVKTRIHNMLEVRLLYKKLDNYNKTLEQAVQERTAELSNLAFYDSLSRLPNRTFFVSYLDQTIIAGDTNKTVALIDIDHFSEFNHAVGYANGDSLLCAVAKRIKESLGSECMLARIVSDNFAIVGPASGINPYALGEIFRFPFVLPDCEMSVSVTMGFTDLQEIQGSGADALKAASIALKLAKANRRGRYEYYASTMENDICHRLEIYQNLRKVLHEKGLAVYYQPQTNLASGRVIGVEALVRWQRKDGEFNPPDQFISIAEHTSLIVDLGAFVFAESCRQLAKWQKNGLQDLRMAINVSMAQFRSRQFLPFVEAILEQTGADSRMLEVEITESMVMNNYGSVIHTLTRLREMGITVAMDDFGTGFSSLGYLQSLPIDRIKVDRSFVKDLGTSDRAGTIAKMIVNLGNTLGLTVIGEGIETCEQEKILRDWGCHEGQGFLWSPAITADAFEPWIRSRQQGYVVPSWERGHPVCVPGECMLE